MRVHIHDDGLRFRNGHYFDCGYALTRSLLRRGHTVDVSAVEAATPEVREAFEGLGAGYARRYTHDVEPHDGPGIERAIQQLADALAQTTEADVWLFPTLTPMQLVAHSLVVNAPPMLGLTHVDPSFLGPFGGTLWRLGSGRLVNRGLPAVLTAIDPVIAEFTETWSAGLPVKPVAIPLGGPTRKSPVDKPRTVGFFGHQREERGSRQIEAMVGALLKRDFDVVVHDTTERFRSAHPRVRAISGFVDDLSAEMATCDIVVCLMDRRRYAHRHSGIACFALAAGIPFAVSAGTLSAVRFGRSSSVQMYAELTPDSVMSAVDALTTNYTAATAAAQRASTHWHTHHGIEPFVDRFLAEIAGLSTG